MKHSHPEFYLRGSHVPSIFLEADRQYDDEHENDPIPAQRIKKVPMPFITGCKGANGPVIVTEDWVVKKEKKYLKNRSEDIKEMQIEMMQLIGKRDRLKKKLGELDIGKKKDARRIVAINVQLKDIDAELQMLQAQSGINLNNLDRGTRLARFIGAIKGWFKRRIRKLKKVIRENKELIYGMASIILPFISTIMFRRLVI